MAAQGYDYTPDSFAQLLIAKSYPERTDSESAILRDYLKLHLSEFDRVSFSVRVGQGITPDPSMLPGVQRQAILNSMKRIDLVGYFGRQATLVEAKTRVGSAVMGQLLSDRQLWVEQYPEDPEPRLVAIGRFGDEESLRVLADHGIAVFLYATPVAA